MRHFFLNPLSITARYHTTQEFYPAFTGILNCLKFIWPMISAGRASLSIDSSIGARSIVHGENFVATLSHIRAINGDMPRLWYLYTKNRGASTSTSVISIQVSSKSSSCIAPVRGDVGEHNLRPDATWLSFGGTGLNESVELVISHGSGTFIFNNAYHLESLCRLLPAFEHSDKHKEYSYFDQARKENVGAMPIRDTAVAGELLRNGFPLGADIISYHVPSQTIFRFRHTRANIYHGFVVQPDEIPANLLKELTE